MVGNNHDSAMRDALETVVRQCGDRLTEVSGNTALLPHICSLLALEVSPKANLPSKVIPEWRGLTHDERTQMVSEPVELGTGFVTPLYAVIDSIERKLMERNASVKDQS